MGTRRTTTAIQRWNRWLLPAEADRARFAETEARERWERPLVAGCMLVSAAAVAPYTSRAMWILVALGVLGLAFVYVPVPNNARAVHLIVIALVCQAAGAIGVAGTGGMKSPIMCGLLIIPAALMPRFGPRALTVGVGGSVLVTAAALIWVEPWPTDAPDWIWAIGLVVTATGLFVSLRSSFSSELQVREHLRVDPLTGIGSRQALRSGLEDTITEAARAGGRVCALVVDIDRFKSINDNHGHAAGDAALRSVARAIAAAVAAAGGQAYRLGGDEFVVLLCNVDDVGGADHAARITAAVEVFGADLRSGLTVSVGFATASAAELGSDPEALIAAADSAMYLVKKRGSGT